MFLKLKSLTNGSASAYSTVLANVNALLGFEAISTTDTSTGSVIRSMKLNYGDSLNEDVLVKRFYGPQTAPTIVATGSTTGNGTMSVPTVSQVNAVAETWTITMSSPTAFAVSGSVTGATAAGVAGTAYDNGYVAFTITAGGTPMASLDTFSIVVKDAITTLTSYLESADMTGTPVVTPSMTAVGRAPAKFTRTTNLLAQSPDSATSYVNPNNVVLVQSHGAYFLTSAPTVTGTGNGTMTAPVIAPTVCAAGVYTVTFTSATAFSVTNSASVVVGTGALAGTATGDKAFFNQAGIAFTITNGATDFVANDYFTITVTAGTKLSFLGSDNSDVFSSTAIATWASGLGAKDLELVVLSPSAAAGAVPTAVATTVNAMEYGDAVFHKTVLTLTACPLSITDEAGISQWGGVKVYTMPVGAIAMLGAVIAGNLTLGTTGTIITTFGGINSLGTAAASATGAATLVTTAATWLQETANSAAVARVAAINSHPVAAILTETGARWVDGTTTAPDVYLNFKITDDATHTSGTGSFTGTITMVWANLGDHA